MQANQFMLKVVEERGGEIRLVHAEEQGMPCWFYLKLNPKKLAEYERKLKQGTLDIRDYGQILHSGWGTTPPPDVIDYMREEYGYETPAE